MQGAPHPSLRASPHCHHCRHCPTPITVDIAQPPSLLGITPLPSLLGITPPPSLRALPNPHHCGHHPTAITAGIAQPPSMQALSNSYHCRHCPIPSLWALPHIHHCRHYLLHTYPWGHFPTPITVGIIQAPALLVMDLSPRRDHTRKPPALFCLVGP